MEDLQAKEKELERSRAQKVKAAELQNLFQSLQAGLNTQKKAVESHHADAKATDEKIADIKTKTNTSDAKHDTMRSNQKRLEQELTVRKAEMGRLEKRYNGDVEQPGMPAELASVHERMATLRQEIDLAKKAAHGSQK